MMRIFFLVCLIGLLGACQDEKVKMPSNVALDSAPEEVKDSLKVNQLFESEVGGFRIAFPGLPVADVHNTELEIGQIKLHQFIYSEDNLKAWLVSYSDYPEEMIALGSNSQLLKGIKHRVLKGLKASPSIDVENTFQGQYPGFSFVAHSKSNKIDVVYSNFLVQNRVYQISMYSSVGPFSTQDSSAFIGSFQLINEQDSL